MAPLIPILVANLASMLALLAASLYVYRRSGEYPMLLWGIAWAVFILRFVFSGFGTFINDNAVFEVAESFCVLAGSGLLLAGTYRLTGRRMAHSFTVLLATAALLTLLAHLWGSGFLLRNAPSFLASGGVMIAISLVLWGAADLPRHPRRFVALLFFIWGVHKFDYPLLRNLPDFAVWGYTAAFALEIAIAIGLFILYYEKQRESLQQSERLASRFVLDNPVPIISYADGEILSANRRALDLVGASREEILVGTKLSQWIEPEQQDAFEQKTGQFEERPGTTVEMRATLTQVDGQQRHLEIHSIPLPGDSVGVRVAVLLDVSKEILAQQALLESESHYRSIVENAFDAIYVLQGRNYVYVNPRFCEITGYDEQTLTAPDFEFNILLTAQTRDLIEERYKARVEQRPVPSLYEVDIVRSDGVTRRVEVTTVALSEGREMRVLGIMRDITEVVTVRHQLAARNDELELFFAQNNDGIYFMEFAQPLDPAHYSSDQEMAHRVSSEARLSRVNDAFLRQYRLDRDALRQAAPKSLPGYEAEQFSQFWSALLHHGRWQLLRDVVDGHGETLIVEGDYALMYSEEGTLRGYSAVERDVTATRKAEEQLKKLSRAVESTPTSIVITNRDGIIEYVNPAFVRVTGFGLMEALGRNPRILKSGKNDPRIYEELWTTILDGKTWSGELLNRKKSGEEYWETVSIAPVFDELDQITHFVGVKLDISDQRRLQEQFLQSQKMEAVGRLAGGIAHDFNNLLTAITGSAELLMVQHEENEELAEDLQDILAVADRASSLTRQLLTFSRREEVQRQRVEPNQLLQRMERLLRRLLRENISLSTQLDKQVPDVMIDPGQLEQVIVNLAINAGDAMPGGGELEVGTQVVLLSEDDGLEADMAPGPYARITVRDRGQGIDPEHLEHIFEPFYTTKESEKGTGLGLSTAYGIVRQAGGRIQVESTVGEGSRFVVDLPAAQASMQAANQGQLSLGDQRGHEKVLVVEDDPLVRSTALRSLRHFGYEVVEAEDGESALEILHTDASDFDLVLTDIVMKEMSGLELAGYIAAIEPELPIIFMSGHVAPLGQEDTSVLTDRNFINKPFSAARLAELVRKRLDEAKRDDLEL